jgi:hypothetical protein
MKTSSMRWFAVSVLVAESIALSSCGQSSSHTARILYRPLGICKGYETPAGLVTAGPNKGFAVFSIESVDNANNDTSFTLAPERLFVTQSPPILAAGSANRRFVYPDPRFAQAMGFTKIPETTVPAGEKLDINGVIIIPLDISNPNGGAEANQFSFELAYDTGAGEKGDQQNVNDGIVFTMTKPPDAKWSLVENCNALPFN